MKNLSQILIQQVLHKQEVFSFDAPVRSCHHGETTEINQKQTEVTVKPHALMISAVSSLCRKPQSNITRKRLWCHIARVTFEHFNWLVI